ncbi:MAG TPA: thermopsin family protease [Thermoplasmata archaeon]|nr:thermopsin family protease [Thermoplasmata archaeon]
MTRRSRSSYALLGLVAFVLVASSLGSAGALAPAPGGASPTAAPAPAGHAPRGPSGPSAVADVGASARSAAVERVERQIAGHAFAGRNAFLPTPIQMPASPPGAAVAPIQQAGPAPMGLADLGLGKGGAYAYNTSSFQGSITLAAYTTYSPGYPAFDEAPDWSAIQLNTVGVNISYPGATDGTFWFQNVAHLNGTELQLEDNIWNFSNAKLLLPASTIKTGNGTIQTGEFYYYYAPTLIPVAFPLTVTLRNSLVIADGVPAAYFNYSVDSGGTFYNGSYDTVFFNGPASASAPPRLSVDGYKYNPEGSEYDTELDVGGDGGGTNAVVLAAAGNATLDRWNATSTAYETVPSAYDHGVDSAETSTGLAAYYTGTTEFLGQGPSLLYGLWNTVATSASASAAPGWIAVDLTLTPTYAFAFATNDSSFDKTLPRDRNLTYAPSTPSGSLTTLLPPPPGGNPYVFAAWANGYLNASLAISGNTTASLTLTKSTGVLDAPVYLTGDAQVAAYGAVGVTGTGYSASRQTLWINASTDTLAPPFLRINDVGYPTFVLLAIADANLTIDVNRFVQATSSFEYSYWNSVDLELASTSLPGWTQYYGFFGGRGAFAVTNTTLTGNTTLFLDGVYSPAAIEFVGTNDSRASALSIAQYSYGVDLVGASNVTVRSVTSLTGASGVSATNATNLTVDNLTANGSPAFASTGIYAVGGSHDHFATLNVSNESQALNLTNASDITIADIADNYSGLAAYLYAVTDVSVTGLAINNDAVGFEVNESAHVAESDISVAGEGYAGWVDFSHDVTIDGLAVVDSDAGGFDFANDTAVTVEHGSAVGDVPFDDVSSVVQSFTNSTGGTFAHISAAVQSIGVDAAESTDLTFLDLSATTNSVGASVQNATWVNATGINASSNSTGLAWNEGTNGTLSTGTIGNNSTGVVLSNATHIRVNGLVGFEPSYGVPYYTSELLGYLLPVTPVALYITANITVTNISADGYPFGVWANYTNYSTFDGITAWNGVYGVQLNSSGNDSIGYVFAQGNVFGAVLNNTSDSNLSNSTFEDSSTYGLWIHNGTNLHVDRSNFVANNNSSTSGSYSDLHLQAWVNNSSAIYFNASGGGVGNYWADHGGSGAYVLHAANSSEGTVEDAHPQTAFDTNWLKFVAVNLPAMTLWGFGPNGSTLPQVNYTTMAPLVFLPAWALPIETINYGVHPTSGYVPSPSSGEVDWTGAANITVTIQFALVVTFIATGLPAGTSWTVTFNGTAMFAASNGHNATISFTVPNGKYAYKVAAVADYAQSSIAASGSVTVAGTNLTYTIAYKSTLTPSSSTPWLLYAGIGAGVAVVAIVAALLVVRARARRPKGRRPTNGPDRDA